MLENGFLKCDTCGTPIMKAPQGATAKTKASCKICTRRTAGSGFVELDMRGRPVRNPSVRLTRGAQKWWDGECAENRQRKNRPIDAEMSATEITQEQLEAMLERAEATNPRFEQCAGQRWVRALCADNLRELTDMQRSCLVLVSIMGVSISNAAKSLHVRRSTVAENNLRAQRRLSHMDMSYSSKLFKTQYIKSCYVQ